MALTVRRANYFVEATPITVPAHIADADIPPLPPLPERIRMQMPPSFPWPLVLSFICNAALMAALVRVVVGR